MKHCFRFLILSLVGAVLAVTTAFPRTEAAAHATARTVAPTVETTAQGRVTRFLVMGVDRAAKLADTLFVVTLDESVPRATVLQIPRDTYAAYTERDYKKLNGCLGVLGEKGTKDLLSRALGVPIHYFVVLDLSCFSALVDAVGGVDVDIPHDMDYSDPAQGLEIHLPAGHRHLDGCDAEQFVRFRAGYVNADLGRLDAQKLFLKGFAAKCVSLSSGQTMQMLSMAMTKLQTDIGLPAALRVMELLRRCDPDQISMATLAGQAAQGNSGAWYYIVNREGGRNMVNEYLLPTHPLTAAEFDPDGLFDRGEHELFHKIYIAPEGSLPLA